ncbi:MiaB/RimO family radical SAM methylthiotransferase [Bacteroidota bacterium]
MKKLYIETYGCQMNFSDSEIVGSIMVDQGWEITKEAKNADFIFLNTCSIRDNAEQRIWKRLQELRSLKKKNKDLHIGVLGCMAERLKHKLLDEEKAVDLIAGPDSYRDLPQLITDVESGQKAINVILSSEETYADISPVRYNSNGVSAFISIMRGCENHCAYCVVPSVRGKERSRNPETILREAIDLSKKGYREITLLGQNVNSYSYKLQATSYKQYEESAVVNSQQSIVNPISQSANQPISQLITFPNLLDHLATSLPTIRFRFATSHPKDISDQLLQVISRYFNICNAIHLPVQSGSSRILDLMKRKYTRERYMNRIEAIRKYIPDCGISTDIITGFPGETEEDHKETLSLMEWVGYDFAYMFKYSERPNTIAAKKYNDDVTNETKSRRLKEVIDLQQQLSLKSNLKDIGKTFEVLIEGTSKRSKNHLFGRNSQNKVVVFLKGEHVIGEIVNVRVNDCTTATLKGLSIG